MTMSKRDYVAIAKIIKDYTITDPKTRQKHIQYIALTELTDYFAAGNPAFDEVRFMTAAGFGERGHE